MDIQTREALITEINNFKKEALKMHIVEVLAKTYEHSSLFDCNIDVDGSVIWYKAQACQLWDFWKAAKAQAVPELCASVEAHKIIIDEVKTEINDGYDLCQDSYLLDVLVHRGIQIGKAQAVPEGFVLVKNDTKTVVAIERMVEQQVEASGMDSRRLERLDGWRIIEAAIEAQEQSHEH